MLFSFFERYWDEPRALPRRVHRATGKDALKIDKALRGFDDDDHLLQFLCASMGHEKSVWESGGKSLHFSFNSMFVKTLV